MIAKRIAVVGLGNMGEKHVKTCLEHPGCGEVIGCTRSPQRRAQMEQKWGIKTVSDYRELLGCIDAAVIAVPTQVHMEVARWFLENRIPVLLEKPISANMDEANRLVELAGRLQTVLQVGHVERFNPAWRAAVGWWAGKVQGPPHRITAYRLSPPPLRNMGTGVVLDVMIHDIDLILSLLGADPENILAQTLSLDGEDDDLCMAALQFPCGTKASVTACRFTQEKARKMELTRGQVRLTVDFLHQKAWASLENDVWEELPVEPGMPLAFQLSFFLDALDGHNPAVSAREAARALKVCFDILHAAQ